MNWGHKRPSSNDRTVPDTAPTAKRMVVPLAQRLANRRYAASPVARNLHSAMVIIRGSATPMTAKMMWKAKDIPIWERAAARLSISPHLDKGYEEDPAADPLFA